MDEWFGDETNRVLYMSRRAHATNDGHLVAASGRPTYSNESHGTCNSEGNPCHFLHYMATNSCLCLLVETEQTIALAVGGDGYGPDRSEWVLLGRLLTHQSNCTMKLMGNPCPNNGYHFLVGLRWVTNCLCVFTCRNLRELRHLLCMEVVVDVIEASERGLVAQLLTKVFGTMKLMGN